MQRKVHYSNWHITINANQPNKSARVVARELTEAINALLRDNVYDWLRYFDADTNTQRPLDGNERAEVMRVRAQAALERGGDNNRSVHAHILLEVQHTTMLHVDYRVIRDIISAYTGNSVNVSTRFAPGDGEDKNFLLHYISKEVARETDPLKRGNRGIKRAFVGPAGANRYYDTGRFY